MPRKPASDYDHFMANLNRIAGEPRVRWKTRNAESTEVKQWWCPSCRQPRSLQLAYPDWLPYPKPRCANCSDVEVYEALELQELAYRGDSPPLVVCHVVQSYRKKTGHWPAIGTAKGEWRGACRTCDGCRDFTKRRQAHQLSVAWAGKLAELAGQLDPPWVRVIEIPEADKRRVIDALTYRIDRGGGAIAHIPVESGRVIFAAFGRPSHGRVIPLIQRLVREGEYFEERLREPDEFRFGWTVGISLEEQLERRLFDTLLRRVWEIDGHALRISFKQRQVPAENHNGTST